MPNETPPGPPRATQQPRWSRAQLARIETEWRELRRAYSFHPVVTVVPLAGDPPHELQLDYRLKTLVTDDAGDVAFAETCSVHLWLPPQFPLAGPVIRPLSAVFHPNVDDQGLHLAPAWNPASGTLADVVARCGHMLAFQIYDPAHVQNVPALQWVMAYPQHIPTDPDMVLRADGGGDAMERLAQAGGRMLDEHRAQLTAMCDGIRDGRPGTARPNVQQLGERLVIALELFTDPGVPDDLRKPAAELVEWAKSMTPERSIWDEIRSLTTLARASQTAETTLRPAHDALESRLRELEARVPIEPAAKPTDTIARLPTAADLDLMVIRLRSAVQDVESAAPELRTALATMSATPPPPFGTPGTPVYVRTSADIERAFRKSDLARQAAVELMTTTDPLLARAKQELAAVEGLATWMAFNDLVRHGNELAQRVIDLGAAGFQAYYLQLPGAQSFALHQFEERIDTGHGAIVVRRLGHATIEVFDARNMAQLGKGPSPLRVKIVGKDRSVREAEIRATPYVDEVRVQLEYAVKVSREQVTSIAKIGGSKATSWAGKFAKSLAHPDATLFATDMHRRANHQWSPLLTDLEELSAFKERQATSRLLDRHVEFVPALLSAKTKAQVSLAEANERLTFIAQKSTRDAATGVVVVKPQFAPENVERLQQRERAEKDLAKIDKMLSRIGAEVQTRLGNDQLLGKPNLPKLRLVKTSPGESMTNTERWSNGHIQTRVSELERLLGTRLRDVT